MVSAVMKDASSEARNAATAAMSSTEPNLLSVDLSISSFLCRIITVKVHSFAWTEQLDQVFEMNTGE